MILFELPHFPDLHNKEDHETLSSMVEILIQVHGIISGSAGTLQTRTFGWTVSGDFPDFIYSSKTQSSANARFDIKIAETCFDTSSGFRWYIDLLEISSEDGTVRFRQRAGRTPELEIFDTSAEKFSAINTILDQYRG